MTVNLKIINENMYDRNLLVKHINNEFPFRNSISTKEHFWENILEGLTLDNLLDDCLDYYDELTIYINKNDARSIPPKYYNEGAKKYLREGKIYTENYIFNMDNDALQGFMYIKLYYNYDYSLFSDFHFTEKKIDFLKKRDLDFNILVYSGYCQRKNENVSIFEKLLGFGSITNISDYTTITYTSDLIFRISLSELASLS